MFDRRQTPIGKSTSLETVSIVTTSSSVDDTTTNNNNIGNDNKIDNSNGDIVSNQDENIKQSQKSPTKNLYNLQIQILCSSTLISFISFLFSFLNIYAFITFMLFASSVILLVYTAFMYVRYLIVNNNGTLALCHAIPFLPEGVREYIIKSSLHDVLLDMTSFVYSREEYDDR